MTILDLDLDFFLDDRALHQLGPNRLPPHEFTPWTASEVRKFLTEQCRVTTPLPGAVVVEHDEVFDEWRRLINAGQISTPFDLVHVDAHADMGMGGPSIGYLCIELLHESLEARQNPKRGDAYGLTAGNYVNFAIGCRWVSSLTYVYHPELRTDFHDIPDMLFENDDPTAAHIQLKLFPKDTRPSYIREAEPIGTEPKVPFQFANPATFRIAEPPSFIFLAQSPYYTPATSDALIDVIREFIAE